MSSENTKFQTRRRFSIGDYYGLEIESSPEQKGLWLVSKTYQATEMLGPGKDYYETESKSLLPIALAVWLCADFEKKSSRSIGYSGGTQYWEKDITAIPNHFTNMADSAVIIKKNTHNFPQKEAVLKDLRALKSFSCEAIILEEKARNPFWQKVIWAEATKNKDGTWSIYEKYFSGMRNNKPQTSREISKSQSLDTAALTLMKWKTAQLENKTESRIYKRKLLTPEILVDICEWVDFPAAQKALAEKNAKEKQYKKAKANRDILHKKAQNSRNF